MVTLKLNSNFVMLCRQYSTIYVIHGECHATGSHSHTVAKPPVCTRDNIVLTPWTVDSGSVPLFANAANIVCYYQGDK
jgi:hypothetical protein